MQDRPDPTSDRATALDTQWSLGIADPTTARIIERRRETIRDAERRVPKSWRRVFDPHGRGLTWAQLAMFTSARDRLAADHGTDYARELRGHTGRLARRAPAPPRPVGAMRQSRPRARRTAASSSTSSADPPGHGGTNRAGEDDPPGEPPPRWITLWAHPEIRGGGHS